MSRSALPLVKDRPLELRGPGVRGEFFSECVSGFFSKRSLDKLEYAIGRSHVGLLTTGIDDFYSLVETYGEDVGLFLLGILRDIILRNFNDFFPGCNVIAIEHIRISDNIICFDLPNTFSRRLPGAALAFRLKLVSQFRERTSEMIDQLPDLLVGYSWISREQKRGFYKILFKAFCDARRVAIERINPETSALHEEFISVLETSALTVAYQPVADFRSGLILGWDAFVYGPENSHFHRYAMLSGYAEQVGKVFSLERRCQEAIMREFGRTDPNQHLFINIHLKTLNDPASDPGMTRRLLRQSGLRPENVVLAFSEAHGIRDFSLLMENLEHYRAQGFKIAIDDVGIGHASLRIISQARPDYIRIAPSLIRGIDLDPVKRTMTKSLALLSRKIGFNIIANGIETATELSSLIALGISFGQGNHIAAPAFPKPSLCVRIPARPSFRQAEEGDLKCAPPIRQLVNKTFTVSPDTAVREVKAMLAGQPPTSSVVIVENRKPVGLLMNYNLDRKLGSPYGVSLYYHRDVARLMDRAPLVAEINTPVEEVAKAAMNRKDSRIYDDIIVNENGCLVGTVSVRKMLAYLAEVQVKIAMGANPLTGLPGNVAIEQEISQRAAGKIPSSLIYIDLDNFKVYNDVYGFENGDQMILFTAKTIREAVERNRGGDCFVGHVGGDDFVVISNQQEALRLAKTIADIFEEKVPALYRDEDRQKGYVAGKGRDGVERAFPMVSVSIGIVDCQFDASFTMDELSHRVAEIKKYAKSVPGNSYVRDRRTPLGSADTAPDSDENYTR